MLDYYPQKRFVTVDLIGHEWMQGEFPLSKQVMEEFTNRNEMIKELEK